MAPYPKIESIGSIRSSLLAILKVPVVPNVNDVSGAAPGTTPVQSSGSTANADIHGPYPRDPSE